MTLLFIALFVGPMIAAAYSAQRRPPAMTGFKMAAAGGLLTIFMLGYTTYGIASDDTTDAANLNIYSTLLTIFAVVGTPACAGYAIGAVFGLSHRFQCLLDVFRMLVVPVSVSLRKSSLKSNCLPLASRFTALRGGIHQRFGR